MDNKKLVRSETDKSILGVAAGLGNYLGIDKGLMRFIFVIATLATGLMPGLIAYAVLAFIMSPEGSAANDMISDGLDKAGDLINKAADKVETVGQTTGEVIEETVEKQPDLIIDNKDDFLS